MKQLISILLIVTILNLYCFIQDIILNGWRLDMIIEGASIVLGFWVFEKYRQIK